MEREESTSIKRWHIVLAILGVLLLRDFLSRSPKPVDAAVINPCKVGQ